MADLSTIDLASLLEREAAVRFGKVVGKKDPVRKGGPCPFCGKGEDRFAVFVVDVPHHYLCGIHGTGCGAYGDAITFLREFLGMSYVEACDYLAIDPGRKYDGPCTRQALCSEASLAPTDTWQKQAARFCLRAKEALWSSQWAVALEWLTGARQLSPAMIARYGLGFNPKSTGPIRASGDFPCPRGKRSGSHVALSFPIASEK
jgi:DNA primase